MVGQKGKMKALVVEDVATHQMVLEFQLRLRGFEVDKAGNGLEALEKLKVNKYQVIFSDIEMPQMNGFQFLEELRKTDHAGIPIVVLTSHNQPEEVFRAKYLGASAYIEKPFNNKIIADTLTQLGF